jgi:cytochrome P450
MHSEAHFKDPMDFRPERYLKGGKLGSETLDPEAAAFGFGRRICPGRHLSNAALTHMVASLLAVFNIERAKDPNGKPIDVQLETTPGFIMYVVVSASTLSPRLMSRFQ